MCDDDLDIRLCRACDDYSIDSDHGFSYIVAHIVSDPIDVEFAVGRSTVLLTPKLGHQQRLVVPL